MPSSLLVFESVTHNLKQLLMFSVLFFCTRFEQSHLICLQYAQKYFCFYLCVLWQDKILEELICTPPQFQGFFVLENILHIHTLTTDSILYPNILSQTANFTKQTANFISIFIQWILHAFYLATPYS